MDGKDKDIEKKLPKHGGKYGKLNRPSRTKKRKYHPPKSKKVVTCFDTNDDSENLMDIDGALNPSISSTSATVSCLSSSSANNESTTVTLNLDEDPASLEAPSASSYKLSTSFLNDTVPDLSQDLATTQQDCYVIMDTGLLLDFFVNLKPPCPECGCKLIFSHDIKKKAGLAHYFNCSCECKSYENCQWHQKLCSSKPAKRLGQQRRAAHEINLRSLIAFREIGRGLKSLKDFCRIMNIPPPMDKRAYKKSFTYMYQAYSAVARKSMEVAASQVVGNADDQGINNVIASFDGSWQRRGYSSLNGVVSCVSNRKVVDFEVLSKVCHQCKYWNNQKDNPNYSDWSLFHNCPINHKGSSGSMEVNGVAAIYKRSIDTLKLRYTTYLGDGDSKAYQEVSASNVYPGHEILKAECIGHVQKRVGARLRSYINNYKGQKLDDGKGLTGQGRLTNKVMNTLQNYYGLVMRSDYTGLADTDKLYTMKKGIAAIIHHCSDIVSEDGEQELEKRHQYCPRGEKSWCKYQRDCATGLNTYKAKINLPPAVSDILKPIFSHTDLGSDDLLKKCLHGQTQNVNESFNQCIWKKAPKETFVSRQTLEIAVCSAVLNFNDGARGVLEVLKHCGIIPGHYCSTGTLKANEERVIAMNRKADDKVKKRRKHIHAVNKGFVTDNVDSYAPGAY